MLVLRRKIGEGIIIGKNVIIRILDIEQGDVKIGIEAPKDVKILREELYKEIANTNVEAKDFNISRAKDLFRKGE
ncbi:carbon storage regulator CsrA [Mesoaciditoga lauensis]|uniref:carbon storage regulator CsrA n=1 Tax=Mesoaciditoga lauensis TaxID=1495039 RepID=UPI0005652327|nr:carbon storage regulator CsrA [Mesoaciditoga lauensis]